MEILRVIEYIKITNQKVLPSTQMMDLFENINQCQISAKRGTYSRFVLEANLKSLCSQTSRSLI